MKEAYNKDEVMEDEAVEKDTEELGDEELLEEARAFYKYSSDATADQRKDMLDDQRFVMLDEHWPEEIRRQREREKRPCLTIPRLKPFVRQVVNDARQNKPQIVIHPADSKADKDTANIISGLIRNIEVSSKADIAYDTAVEHAVTMGIGYIRVNVADSYDDSFDMDIKIERITNPLSVHYDVDSTAADSSDWNQCIVETMISHKEFEKKYPDAEMVDWESATWSELGADWCTDKHVLVCEYWKREQVMKSIVKLNNGEIMDKAIYEEQQDQFEIMGLQITNEKEVPSHKVTQYILSGLEVLEKIDWAGKYIPIIPVYGEEICVENTRIFRSMIHSAKDAQRRLNYWTTTTTELVALSPRAPFIGPVGAFATDAHKWATANTDNHAYIEYNVVDNSPPPQRQPFAGPPAGALQEAMNAGDDIKSILGMYDASLGAKSNETSGVAIRARQHEGDVGTFHFIDNLRRAIRCVATVIIDIMPATYTGERVVRTLGENNKDPKNVKIGKQAPQMQGQQYPEGMERIYDLSLGKYDLTISTGPSFSTRREEAAAQMMDFVQAFPAAAPLVGDLLASYFDWPGADEMSKRLKAMLPPQLQEGGDDPEKQGLKQQMQQMSEQMQMMHQQAQQAVSDISQKLQEAEMTIKSNQLDKEIETRKLEVDEYNAATNRAKALQTGMTPEQVELMLFQMLQNMQLLPTEGNMVHSQPQMQPMMQDNLASVVQQPDQRQQMPAPTDNGVQ